LWHPFVVRNAKCVCFLTLDSLCRRQITARNAT
jgi:hypothetical protein